MAAAAAVGAACLVALAADVRAAAQRWGERSDVWVAATDHAPGAPVEAVMVSFPSHLVPGSALEGDPSGEVVGQRVAAGEVLVRGDLVGPPGPTALAPDGWVVVALRDPLIDTAVLGASVSISSDGVVIAEAGVVTAAADGVISVAVPAAEAPFVAAAAQSQAASLLFPSGRSVTVVD